MIWPRFDTFFWKYLASSNSSSMYVRKETEHSNSNNFLNYFFIILHMIFEIFHHHHHSWSTPTGDSLFKGPPLLLESVLWFCDKGEVLWWSWPPVKVGSGGISPSFMRFFCFILRFWNQILTWVSLSWRAPAISILLARVRYLLKWNSFSNSVNCLVVKLVLPVLLMPPGLGWPP